MGIRNGAEIEAVGRPHPTREGDEGTVAKRHRVGIIGGDGIGPEVVAEGLKVVAAAGVALDTVDYDLGGARYLRDETILPDATLAEWRSLDALFFGAVGTPEVPPGVIERGLLLKMRFELDLYVNQRPFIDRAKGIDFIVI